MPLQYSVSQIEQKLRTYLSQHSSVEEQKLLGYALEDIKHHHNNFRKDGSPYYLHPMRIALKVCEYGFEGRVVIASLLHDLLEDTAVDEKTMRERYGEWYVQTVDGLSKVKAHLSETHHKLLYTSFKHSSAVFFIKLFDRWDNLKDMKLIRTSKRKRIGKESLYGYLPIIRGLGLETMSYDYEKVCFRYMYPKTFTYLEKKLLTLRQEQATRVWELTQGLQKLMNSEGIEGKILIQWFQPSDFLRDQETSETSLRKVKRVLKGLRIIVGSKKECYQVLGMVHLNHQVSPRQARDYIANPLYNGYCRLQTEIIHHLSPVRIEIADYHSNELSCKGIIAYWQSNQDASCYQNYLAELESLLTSDTKHFDLRIAELFKQSQQGRIQVLVGEEGQNVSLPQNATVLDLAYYVSTELGHHCAGGLLQKSGVQERVSRGFHLQDGHWIKILQDETLLANESWRVHTSTQYAKLLLEKRLDQQASSEAERLGKKLFDAFLNNKGKCPEEVRQSLQFQEILEEKGWDLGSFFRKIGRGNLGVSRFLYEHQILMKRKVFVLPFLTNADQETVAIKDLGLSLLNFAKCCQVLPNDACLGVRYHAAEELEIHRRSCKKIPEFSDAIAIKWSLKERQLEDKEIILVHSKRRENLYKIWDILGNVQCHYFKSSMLSDKEMKTTLQIQNISQTALINLLKRFRRMRSVKRFSVSW